MGLKIMDLRGKPDEDLDFDLSASDEGDHIHVYLYGDDEEGFPFLLPSVHDSDAENIIDEQVDDFDEMMYQNYIADQVGEMDENFYESYANIDYNVGDHQNVGDFHDCEDIDPSNYDDDVSRDDTGDGTELG